MILSSPQMTSSVTGKPRASGDDPLTLLTEDALTE